MVLKILIIVLSVILLLFLIIGFIIAKMNAKPWYKTRDYQREWFKQYGFDLKALEKGRESISFMMDDEYIINGDIGFNKNKTNKYMLMIHGHRCSREGERIYQKLFEDLGFNTVIIDLRSCGDNIKEHIHMGYVEAMDVVNVIDQLKQRYGQDIKVSLHGVSMGSATVLLATQYNPDVEYIISDCGYATLNDTVGYLLKQKGIFFYKLLLPFINLFMRLCYGFSNSVCSPIKAIDKTGIPILFIHGGDDKYVPTSQVYKLYDKCKSYKELKVFDGASHANSFLQNKAEYQETIKKFIENVEKRY